MAVNRTNLGSAALDGLVNICLPFFTLLGYLLVSSQTHTEWVLAVCFMAGACWVYSAYRAWKVANQAGIMITAVLILVLFAGRMTNVWEL